jgi:hypothetical protein
VTFYRTLFAQHQSIIELLAAQGSDLFSTIPGLSGDPVSSGTTQGGEAR